MKLRGVLPGRMLQLRGMCKGSYNLLDDYLAPVQARHASGEIAF